MDKTPYVICDNPKNAQNLSIHNVEFDSQYDIGDILQITSSLGQHGYLLVIDANNTDDGINYNFMTMIGGEFAVDDLRFPKFVKVA